MTASALLTDLRARGVALVAHGERLACNGPGDVLTPETLDLLRAHKPALLGLLADKGRSDLLLLPGEEPRWCACCGIELLDARSALCGWCARRQYEPGEDLMLDDEWRGGVRA